METEPLNLSGKTREELVGMVRDQEAALNLRRAVIWELRRRLGEPADSAAGLAVADEVRLAGPGGFNVRARGPWAVAIMVILVAAGLIGGGTWLGLRDLSGKVEASLTKAALDHNTIIEGMAAMIYVQTLPAGQKEEWNRRLDVPRALRRMERERGGGPGASIER